jgi:hypothetical protein
MRRALHPPDQPAADIPKRTTPLDALLRALASSAEDATVRRWAARLAVGESAASEPAAKRREAPRA